MKRIFIPIILVFIFLSSQAQTAENKNVTPTKAQQEWADAEIGVLIHFDMPVFKPEYNWRRDMGKHPDASVFNPTELNTDQWIKSAKAAGAKYAVLVAKHCSGFSLWPTGAHDYNISKSPYKNGKGDIVKKFIASCKKFGLKPGIYASTTTNGYLRVDNPGKVVSGDPDEQKHYNKIVEKQLTELWTNYGKLFEIWFDGGVLPVDKGGFDILSMVQKYQPNSVAFQGPFGYANNIRWVGNEEGVAPYPCWARADSTTSSSGVIQIRGLNGNPNGTFWCPGEADFPLRRNNTFQGGWFWHKGQDDKLFSFDELMDKYTKSVGQNTNMLLGIVVDNRGLVPDADVERLKEFGMKVKKTFSTPIANTSGKGNLFKLKFKSTQHISFVVIQEDIRFGEHIRNYQLLGKTNGQWTSIAQGESVGHKRIEKVNGKFDTIKLEITENVGTVKLKNFACYE
ncbi:MAG: alpha-L-fucosidase [Prolixibacteraceae bacterium]|nr:alpha-L-fucosidase [Prolixibacteraceae bacterium]